MRYAETHFKFKLPWSFLFRPWPEIIFDIPFQAVLNEVPTLWIVVRDADRFPVSLEQAKITIIPQNSEKQKDVREIELGIEANKSFAFFPIKLEGIAPGRYCIHAEAKVKRLSDGKERRFTRWNLPTLRPEPLTLQVLSEELPKAPGYAIGEMHCHTHYSADHVEYGATPEVFQKAAKAIGLDFVCCTDHAYDFAFTAEDYTREAASPAPRFQALRDEIATLPTGNGEPLLLAGEEVSAGNSKGENVHMTAFAPEEYLPGLGDCGRYWLDNKPTRKIAGHLKATEAPCFAAHPLQPMGILEKFIFHRGYWSTADLNIGKGHEIRGIQFWNGVRDEGFMLGRKWWIEELGKEHYLLPIGGNDAHGDLNDTTAVNLPLFTLRYSRDHVFGKVRTAIKIAGGTESQGSSGQLSEASLKEAFAGDACYITDGPALWWERYGKQLHFYARSTADMGGAFRYIRIIGRRRLPNGKLAKAEELNLQSQVAARAKTDITVEIENYAYLRAECETASGRFAMTSAAKVG